MTTKAESLKESQRRAAIPTPRSSQSRCHADEITAKDLKVVPLDVAVEIERDLHDARAKAKALDHVLKLLELGGFIHPKKVEEAKKIIEAAGTAKL